MSDHTAIAGLPQTGAVTIPGLSGVVWVVGPDAVKFVDALLSQNIATMGDGGVAPSLLLAPNGKLRATLTVLRGGDRVGLVCDAGSVETVIADLARFKIRVDAEITTEDRQVWDVWGADAPAMVGQIPPVGQWSDHDGNLVVRIPFRYSTLPRVVVAGGSPEPPVVDAAAVQALRIELGEPIMGIDLDDRTIPQEGVDVAARVDFDKGCYLGQELVARIDSRGHVNRRLCGIKIEGRLPPESDTEISQDGKVVGSVSSAAWSDSLGSVVALGMVRVEVAAGTQVDVGDVAGVVVDLPFQAEAAG